jgi:hypothetical protein
MACVYSALEVLTTAGGDLPAIITREYAPSDRSPFAMVQPGCAAPDWDRFAA